MQTMALEGFETLGKQTRRDHSNKGRRGYEGDARQVSSFDKKMTARKARRDKLNLRDIEASLASYD